MLGGATGWRASGLVAGFRAVRGAARVGRIVLWALQGSPVRQSEAASSCASQMAMAAWPSPAVYLPAETLSWVSACGQGDRKR